MATGDAERPELTDRELLIAWREGDRAAGARLMTRYVPLLRRFFDRRAASDTEDLMQQTLLACLRSRENIADAASFRAYLLRIARNRLLDHQRARGRSPVEPGTVSSRAYVGTSPSQRVGQQQAQAALLQSMQKLPECQQTVLELHYWEDLRLEELAEILGVTVGTAKSRLRLARSRLQRHLRARLGPRLGDWLTQR